MADRLRLGRLVNHDPRSRSFPAQRATVRVPVLHRKFAPTLDQGNLGSCTGNAMAQACNLRPLHKPGTPWLREMQAVAIYARATVIDPYPGSFPPNDTGSDGLSACKAAAELALIDRYEWAFGIEHALDAAQLAPTLWGIAWYDGMFEPDSKGFVWPRGRVVGGHEIVHMGDNTRGTLTFLNSWGKGWGKGGRFYMREDVAAELLADQGDVAVPRRG